MKRNILMLEPDAVLASTYRQAFVTAGYDVRRSVSAQETVFMVDELVPDVILVELQLVAHSGIEFLYELRSYSEWQHIPVLIHSCIPPIEFQDSMGLLKQMLNVKTYLYKPHTSLVTLLREVRDAMTVEADSDATEAIDHAAFLASLQLQSES